MDLQLHGKRALVTGASTGLGLACALALAAEGATVTLVARGAERLAAARTALGAGAHAVVADISAPGAAEHMVREAERLMGGVDILIANAGGPPPGTFESTALSAYPAALQLSLLSTVEMCKAAVPAMRERGWGRVVAITSIAAREPIAQLILSNTARAGLTGFLKTLATEVARDGVTVNSVQPGLHATDRLRDVFGDTARLAAGLPVGKLGEPEDFGRIVTFLCSDSARFIT
ncbi:MAG: SDR family NAD(P)-dependent oxidoreductase, partial [Gammaproteobacteria bacterium]